MKLINAFNNGLHKRALIQNEMGITYIDLCDSAYQVSLQLKEIGLKSSDIILVISPNSIDLVILLLACLLSEVAPLILPNSNLIDIDIDLLNPRYIFYTHNCNLGKLNINIEDKKHLLNSLFFSRYLNYSYKQNIEADTRLLVTSSGSTGTKKLIQLHETGIMHNIRSNIKSLGICKKDITLMLLPIGYSYGLIAQLLSHLYIGATVVLCNETFYPLHQTYIINKFKATSIFTTPIVLRKCINSLRKTPNCNFSTIRYITIGGSFAEESLIQASIKIYNCNIIKTYGIAEAGPRVSTNIIYKNDPNPDYRSVGKPIENVSIEIDHGNLQLSNHNNNTIGKIVIKSPSISNGYIGESASSIIPKQVLFTNDIGYIGTNGNLYIEGRNGQNIFEDGKDIWFNEIAEIIYETEHVIKVLVCKTGDEIIIKYVPFFFENNYEELFYEILKNKAGLSRDRIRFQKEKTINSTK